MMSEEEGWETDSDNEVGENVKAANIVIDPLSLAEYCRIFSCKDGSVAEISYFAVKDVPQSVFTWMFDLFQRNMKSMYEQSSWGWKPGEKRLEMMEDAARFLIAFIKGQPVAFSHFRFDMDYGIEVLYCYEIQLEPASRSLGLGKHIMTTLERIAKALNLVKTVLTVFTHNPTAITFFTRIGYGVDETSPGEEEKKSYFILSKMSK